MTHWVDVSKTWIEQGGITMQSRERVKLALEHQEPDRVPLDFEARQEVTRGLCALLGLPDEETLLSFFGIDIRRASLEPGEEFRKQGAFFHPRRKWVIQIAPEGVFQDEFGIQYRTDEEDRYFGFVSAPLAQDEALEHYHFPDPGEECRYESIKSVLVKHKDHFFIEADATLTLFEQAWQMSGFEHFMYNMRYNPTWVEKLLDQILAFRMVQCGQYAKLGVDIICLGDDFGMQDRMMVHPDLWRRFFKPRMKTLIQSYKTIKPDVYTRYHSDGFIIPIIPDLIEIGIDILNPIQPESMDLKEIKNNFGTHLTLHGTISVQSLLPFATEEEIQREVTRIIEICAPGGGYILAPTHAIQMDTPLGNVIQTYDTAKHWRYSQSHHGESGREKRS